MKTVMVYKENILDKTIDSFRLDQQWCGATVERMEYHKPLGDGDTHYVDVHMSDGRMERIFRPDTVSFVKEDE